MDTGFIVILSALVAATGSYLVALRRFSGTVSSSAATDLWQESSNIRKWSSEQIDKLQDQVHRLQARVDTVESDAAKLRGENAALRAENAALKVVNDELRKRAG